MGRELVPGHRHHRHNYNGIVEKWTCLNDPGTKLITASHHGGTIPSFKIMGYPESKFKVMSQENRILWHDKLSMPYHLHEKIVLIALRMTVVQGVSNSSAGNGLVIRLVWN